MVFTQENCKTQQRNNNRIMYSGGIAQEVVDECPICYESISTTTNNCKTTCGHSFCFTCIAITLTKQNSCPICRHELFTPVAVIPAVIPAVRPAVGPEVISAVRDAVRPLREAVRRAEILAERLAVRQAVAPLVRAPVAPLVRAPVAPLVGAPVAPLVRLSKKTHFHTLSLLLPSTRSDYFIQYPERLIKYNQYVQRQQLLDNR